MYKNIVRLSQIAVFFIIVGIIFGNIGGNVFLCIHEQDDTDDNR